jgi:hypothetical protein
LLFFWWKTWTVASGNPKITDLEMMKSNVLDVCHCVFFIQAYKKATKLDLDDLYTGTGQTDLLGWPVNRVN